MQRSEHLIVLDQVAAEINRRLPDAAAFNEGNHGGVCCVYAWCSVPSGRTVHIQIVVDHRRGRVLEGKKPRQSGAGIDTL